MEKILYTRCSPWIDLINGGKIIKSEGFGVAAISPDLFANLNGVNFKLLKRIMEDRKGDPNQYEKIYEYVAIGGGKYAFICSGELPLCNEQRANGSGHRPIFMAEAIVGEFSASPAIYMNPENFKGDALSQNDYYRLDLGPDTAPFTLDAVEESALVQSDTLFSLTPQRSQIIASMMTYAYEELSKPENQRTVLFIKDTNENLVGYLDAVIRNLPAPIAKQITFITHTSSYKSNPERYTYYTLTPSGEIMEYNPYAEDNSKANRKMKYLFVGYTQGSPMRNARSEYHLLDAKSMQQTFEVNPGVFFTALASGDPSARKCLNYVNTALGGVLPSDRDGFYSCFKYLLSEFPAETNKAQLEAALTYFLNSEISANPASKEKVITRVESLYPSMMEEDYTSSFTLLSLAAKLDKGLYERLLPAITERVKGLLKGIASHPEAITMYETIDRAGLLSGMETELLEECIDVPTLYGLCKSKGNKESLDFYFSLWKKKLSLGLVKALPENDELMLLQSYASLLSNNAKNPSVIKEIDALLQPYGVKRGQTYTTVIQEAYKERRHEDVEIFIKAYQPDASYKDMQLTLAKMLPDLTYGQFENKFANEFKASGKNMDQYVETLLALFEVYPDAKAEGLTSGYVFGKTLLEAANGENFPAICDYLLKLHEIRGALSPDIVKDVENKSMRLLLQGSSIAKIEPILTALEINGPARLSAVKEKVVKASSAADQQKALEEFASEGGYPIKASDLRLGYFTSILKVLRYEKSFVHVAFLLAFSPEEPKELINGYFRTLKELRNGDGMLFYHSLCLIAVYETENVKTKKIVSYVASMIKGEDNEMLEQCYDKKYEKRLEEIPEGNELAKKAKQKLIDDFAAYAHAHRGFFAKLFGKK